jgi:hypothetical protein
VQIAAGPAVPVINTEVNQSLDDTQCTQVHWDTDMAALHIADVAYCPRLTLLLWKPSRNTVQKQLSQNKGSVMASARSVAS